MVALIRQRAPGEPLPAACPVCRRPWTPAPHGRLVGHTKCQFSEDLQDDLLAILFRFPVTVRRMAEDLGVPLHHNLDAARARRLGHVPGGRRR